MKQTSVKHISTSISGLLRIQGLSQRSEPLTGPMRILRSLILTVICSERLDPQIGFEQFAMLTVFQTLFYDEVLRVLKCAFIPATPTFSQPDCPAFYYSYFLK